MSYSLPPGASADTSHNKATETLNFTVELLKLALPISLLLMTVLFLHYQLSVDQGQTSLEANERVRVELLNQIVSTDVSRVTADTQLLADYFQQLVSSNLTPDEIGRQLLTQFLLVSKHKQLYDHIRLLDQEGNEITRVNYNEGDPIVVSKDKLQNKADRYYFKAINQLEQGEIYISPMDLNVEGDTVELPIKPTIRIGMALFNAKQERVGALILNYNAANLISRFNKAAGSGIDHVMLINREGYLLISPDPQQNWGFMFNRAATFTQQNPAEWNRITAASESQFLTGKGLFTFATAYPYQQHGSDSSTANYWKIISYVDHEARNIPRRKFLEQSAPLYILLLITGFIFAFGITRSRIKHRIAQSLADYERRFRQTLEDIQLAAVTINDKGTITFCNDRLMDLTQRDRNESIGSNWFDLFIAESHKADEQNFLEKMLLSKKAPAEQHESWLVDSNNKQLLVTWSVTPTLDADGNAESLTLIGEDITEKRIKDEQLLTLSRAVEQSPSTVMITDINGDIEYVNRKFESLTGYSPQEVIGVNPKILKSGATSSEEYQELWCIISNGGVWRGELKNRKKNGEFYWELATIAPVLNSEGKTIHFISLKEDITEKKILEEQLELRNQEIVRNRELAAVGKMANMITHDLRNPLSSIKLTLQMIAKAPSNQADEQIQELTQISLSQIRYMESIMADVMSYSRPGALHSEWISIKPLLDSSLLLIQKTVDESNACIKSYCQPGLPTIYADPVKLQQALSNLIINAIQAVDNETARTPDILISVSQLMTDSGAKLKIEIKDNGPGIDPCSREKIFEPFYTNKAKGTGLGLPIVKRYIDLHDGSIRLDPIPGGGTCVTVLIPILPPNANQLATQESPDEQPSLNRR